MKAEDCIVYQLIKTKVNGRRKLTKSDRVEIDKSLEDFCYIEVCEDYEECDRLNNILSDFTPPESRHSDHANAKCKGKDQSPSPVELPQLHADPFSTVRIPLRY